MKKMPPNQDANCHNRALRKSVKALFLLLALIVASFVAVRILILVKVRKLDHMLVELESLKPGISSFDDAMSIGGRYGADKPTEWEPCTRDKCTVIIGITWCNPQWIPTNHLDGSFLNRLGIHFWTAEGSIEVEKGVVVSYGASVAVQGPAPEHRWHEATSETFGEIPPVNPSDQKEFRRNYDPRYDRSPEFLVNWTGSPIGNRSDWLYARVSVHAKDEDRRTAQDFNLKCLTKFGVCSNTCDLLPGAARYYNHQLKDLKSSVPHPQCG